METFNAVWDKKNLEFLLVLILDSLLNYKGYYLVKKKNRNSILMKEICKLCPYFIQIC